MTQKLAGIVGLAAVLACDPVEGDAGTQEAIEAEINAPGVCTDPHRFRVEGAVVRDTGPAGLVWERKVIARVSQPEAVRRCAALELEGRKAWRLPTTHELAAIRLRPGGLFGGGPKALYCVPSIDQVAFPDTPAAEFWTSVTLPDGTAWYVGFDDGRAHRDVTTDTLWVRCVTDL